jgi:hypothetical protein
MQLSIFEQKNFYNEMQNIKTQLLKKELPERYPEEIFLCQNFDKSFMNFYVDRYEFIRLGSFALISKSWVKKLANFLNGKKCLEIMAGQGILAKGLASFGVDIIATDDFSWKWGQTRTSEGRSLADEDLWFPVENLTCLQAIEKYAKEIDYLICCWPYMDPSMNEALLEMRKINPSCKLIYIGEGTGGCTANDDFFENANFIRTEETFNIAANEFQSWWGINDFLRLTS